MKLKNIYGCKGKIHFSFIFTNIFQMASNGHYPSMSGHYLSTSGHYSSINGFEGKNR